MCSAVPSKSKSLSDVERHGVHTERVYRTGRMRLAGTPIRILGLGIDCATMGRAVRVVVGIEAAVARTGTSSNWSGGGDGEHRKQSGNKGCLHFDSGTSKESELEGDLG